MAVDRMQQIRNILSDVGKGFQEDYQLGREDRQKAFYRERELKNQTTEAPKFTSMMGTHPGVFRMQEALGKISPEKQQALQEANMDLRGSAAHKTGQFLGSAAADVTQDTSRGIYWLLNALQATGEVVNEYALGKAVPQIYGKSPVMRPAGDAPLKMDSAGDREYMKNAGILKKIEGELQPTRGYSINKNKEVEKRNYSPGMVQALAIPTGIAINSGLGLLTPFGGAEGYKAAIPSEEDPTKTDNVVGEVGLKYIMGQTGKLLPYDEFKKVRPDVSRDEYNRYQAFKYDKGLDLNPFDDGQVGIYGAVKGTTEGIHGPEVQLLGRSLPVTTGVVPYATALAGGVAGAIAGQRSKRAAMGGLVGGMTGLAVGQVGGNIIEAERRRRNSVENQMEGGSAEQYL